MKRYNQGFFKFGPMEQAMDGEWVKAKDAIDKIQAEIECRKRLFQDYEDFSKGYEELKQSYLRLLFWAWLSLTWLAASVAANIYFMWG